MYSDLFDKILQIASTLQMFKTIGRALEISTVQRQLYFISGVEYWIQSKSSSILEAIYFQYTRIPPRVNIRNKLFLIY